MLNKNKSITEIKQLFGKKERKNLEIVLKNIFPSLYDIIIYLIVHCVIIENLNKI